ncbi:MAG: galactose oxidase-like domain-containing protein [Candidatus Eisenbacteria bacterium]|nr:galactose oxidase-like domain-containing protein [Candidatus Eisenbacteria bacterium]
MRTEQALTGAKGQVLDVSSWVLATQRLGAAILGCTIIGCQGSSSGEPGQSGQAGPAPAVAYVCANDFDLQNSGPTALTVQFAVAGTSERGELLLPARSAVNTPSTTRLTTLSPGALQVSYSNAAISPVANKSDACPQSPRQEPQASSGEWAAPIDWPVVAAHLHQLPSGQVLSWGRIGDPWIWDPATGVFTAIPVPTNVFCSGHTFLPDGRLLVAGGHITDHHGLPDANLFDAATRTWTAVAPMGKGRWYPTTTTLANGEVVAVAGGDQNGIEATIPEVWNGSAWRALSGINRAFGDYPRLFVAPNGLVFLAGQLSESFYLDTSGSGSLTPVATANYGQREYGTAAMYRPGKVLIVGGSDPASGPPTSTAEVIDLSQAVPAWQYTGSMAQARRQLNATLLPDGRVLATGGTSSPGFTDPAGGVRAAEVWDPDSGNWTTWASNRVTRVYHSATLLLPDARILHAGSGDDGGTLPRELNVEIFSPPYLFRGARPSITSAPGLVGYGQQFFVATPDAGQVVRATLVRPSSVTHGFDQNQRFVELSLVRVAGGLELAAPANGNLAPPGDYMLFIMNNAGVPSVSRIVRLSRPG